MRNSDTSRNSQKENEVSDVLQVVELDDSYSNIQKIQVQTIEVIADASTSKRARQSLPEMPVAKRRTNLAGESTIENFIPKYKKDEIHELNLLFTKSLIIAQVAFSFADSEYITEFTRKLSKTAYHLPNSKELYSNLMNEVRG